MSGGWPLQVLCCPRLTQVDLTGPYEILSRMPDTEVHLLWRYTVPVKTKVILHHSHAQPSQLAEVSADHFYSARRDYFAVTERPVLGCFSVARAVRCGFQASHTNPLAISE